MQKKYNIGLDIGTTSVGWAVVESGTQRIIRKGKGNTRKALWGVRLFEEANTAAERRNFRSMRRRYNRRRNRIKLLQQEFKDEINKVDSNFYKKLSESKYNEKDSVNKTIILTCDEKKQIKLYNEKYKTIYHLRNKLITDPSKEDIRLVYLAIHHIIKYRGNFLYTYDNFNSDNLNLNDKLVESFDSLVDLAQNLGISEEYKNFLNIDKISNIIMDYSKNDIKLNLKNELSEISNNSKFSTEFGKMIVGNKFNIKDLLMLDDIEKVTISFDGTDFEDKYNDLEEVLGDKLEILVNLKSLYDTVFLKKIFRNSSNSSLSALMVERYNLHKKDLRLLKELFSADRKVYNYFFKTKREMCVYDKYIHNKISYQELKEEIMKYVLDIINKNSLLLEKYNNVKERIVNDEFLPRITDLENGKYPYQLNKSELIKIIQNQGKYYPFLLEKVDEKYKLVKLLEFKIPYYVGPLVSDKQSKFAWMVKKLDNVKITPYNFDTVIDKEVTAEKFIKRMISHCTYLLGEYALPNSSILYSKYKVMNELKQIKINGEKLTNEIQHKIMNELFMTTSGVITENKFKNYLYSISDFNMYEGDINISGYSADGKFANNMQSYYDFFGKNGIFEGTSYTEEDADEIIEWITIFEDKEILENKVRRAYINLNDNQIEQILNKKYSGWGRLSKKLLTTPYYKDKETGIYKSILDIMYETDENFMQIVNNDEYQFQKMIKESINLSENRKLSYEVVAELAGSPAIKKGIYQSLKVIEELINYMGYEPENIIIEMSRGDERKKERKDDRKKYISKLYDKSKIDISNYNDLTNELNSIDKIDTQKLFLYFIQEGKCLYTGKPLNIEDLNSYEIDHIIPRTLIKDDSIDNKALVYRECNQNKGASLVLPKEYQVNRKWWQHLRKIGLLSPKKFYRLTRTEYKDDDIQDFINRQLVETRQITKHVANIINNFYKNTNVIYLKSNLSHNYRERYELFKFRDINDYHHAHDAYLAAVLGEYKEKYMKKNINYKMFQDLNNRLMELGNFNKLKYGYVINSLDKNVSDIVKNIVDENTDEVVFDASLFNKRVEDTLYRNDILISRKTEIRSGKLFKQTIYSKGEGNIMLKKDMLTEMYGGYKYVETAYLTLVKYKNKIKLIGIPLQISSSSKYDELIKLNFIKQHLNLDSIKNFEILKDKIPFETLINYRGHNVYIRGYSIKNRKCELSNAYQLKIPKDKLKKWKYTLNYVINNVQIPKNGDNPILTNQEIFEQEVEILNYLYSCKEKFPLFISSISKIEERICFDDITLENLSRVILEILKIYHSVNGNLKVFGLSDRIGRLSGFNITTGNIRFDSITSIKFVEKNIEEY